MVWLCGILVAFAIGMFYWNSVLRTYAAQSTQWLQEVRGQLETTDNSWWDEIEDINEVSITVANNIDRVTAIRFLLYSIVMSITIITMVLHIFGIPVDALDFAVVFGIPYMIVSGRISLIQYYELKAEVAAVSVVLRSKINYDIAITDAKQETQDDNA